MEDLSGAGLDAHKATGPKCVQAIDMLMETLNVPVKAHVKGTGRGVFLSFSGSEADTARANYYFTLRNVPAEEQGLRFQSHFRLADTLNAMARTLEQTNPGRLTLLADMAEISRSRDPSSASLV